MNKHKFSTLVLRCLDLNISRRFYESLGLTFTEEQHGKGAIHFACEGGGMVFPVKYGGSDELDNLSLSCAKCNG